MAVVEFDTADTPMGFGAFGYLAGTVADRLVGAGQWCGDGGRIGGVASVVAAWLAVWDSGVAAGNGPAFGVAEHTEAAGTSAKAQAGSCRPRVLV